MSNLAPTPLTDPDLPPGTRVEIRSSLDQRWKQGFEVADVDGDTVRLRRLSDKSVLPVPFAKDEVRRERRRNTWWY